ncbi:MAG: hypothetical protein AB1941_27495 [Gemmatimonadota bacterium]
MSGVVSVTLRTPDGTEHRQTWPTSALGRLQHPGLFERDPEYLAALTAAGWEGWNPRPGLLAPQGYGLVVVDLVHDVILDWQMSTWLSGISAVLLARDAWTPAAEAPPAGEPLHWLEAALRSRTPGPHHVALTPEAGPVWYADRDSAGARFALLYGAGRIRHACSLADGSLRTVPQGDLRGVLAAAREVAAAGAYGWYFVVDPAPCGIETHSPGDASELPSLLARVEALGFAVTPEERRVWEERVPGD